MTTDICGCFASITELRCAIAFLACSGFRSKQSLIRINCMLLWMEAFFLPQRCGRLHTEKNGLKNSGQQKLVFARVESLAKGLKEEPLILRARGPRALFPVTGNPLASRAPMPRKPMRTWPRGGIPGPMPCDPATGGPNSLDPFGAYRRRGGINHPDASVPEIRSEPRGRRHGHPDALKMEPNISRWRGGLPGSRGPDCGCWPIWMSPVRGRPGRIHPMRGRVGGWVRRYRQHDGGRIQHCRCGQQAHNSYPVPKGFISVHMSSFK
jgi:hypothetical protein